MTEKRLTARPYEEENRSVTEWYALKNANPRKPSYMKRFMTEELLSITYQNDTVCVIDNSSVNIVNAAAIDVVIDVVVDVLDILLLEVIVVIVQGVHVL